MRTRNRTVGGWRGIAGRQVGDSERAVQIDTFFGGFLKGIGDCPVKGDRDGDIKPPADEGQTEFFALFCCDLYA